MKKRIFAAVLTLCMLLGFLPAGVLAAGQSSFDDVYTTDWYHEAVEYVRDKGLMSGTGPALFSPHGKTTRGMIVTILYRLAGSPQVLGGCPFSDVRPASYYRTPVTWAVENGIVSGYSATQFGPEDPITREQLALILLQFARVHGYDIGITTDISHYEDYDQISGYAVKAMAWANAAGLISGTSATTFTPKGHATRGQAAVILRQFCRQFVESAQEPEAPDTPETPDKPVVPDKPSVPDKPAEPALPSVPDVPEEDESEIPADADNVFRLSAEKTDGGQSVNLTLELEGDVELCGFDLRLIYDETLLALREVDTGHDLAVYSHVEKAGRIAFNYAGVTNIKKAKTVLTASFDVTGSAGAEAAFSLEAVEVIATDAKNDYAITDTAYTLTRYTVTL